MNFDLIKSDKNDRKIFMKNHKIKDWPSPSQSWPDAPDQPQWPTPSESWPSPKYVIPEWPTPTESWPDAPVYPPDSGSGFPIWKIAVITIASLIFMSAVIVFVVIMVRRMPRNKKMHEYTMTNKSTATDSLLQNENEL